MASSFPLTAKQARAARALLAWSQAELAKAAGVATSTVTDFERGARSPVPNNVQAIQQALEAQGVRFVEGGVVTSASSPTPPVDDGVGKPMRWITASDLAQWGERRDGQAGLPELISRLIYAARGHAALLRFPSDDSIHHAGWDGFCDVDVGVAYIPAGRSAWEIGAQRAGVGRKAQYDYDKGTSKPDGVEPAGTTFVFVTPQRWPGKLAWTEDRRKDGVWRDVQVIDGDDLVHWIERYPAVGVWLAERLGRRPEGLRQLTDLWAEWAMATTPALSPQILLTDRDDQATEVLDWLNGPPKVLSVQAEAADEAMAFLYAAIEPLPDPQRLYREGRCVVAETDAIARDLIGLGSRLIVALPGGDAGLARRLVEDGHHVYAAFGSDVGSPSNVIRLNRPWRHTLELNLEALGLKHEDAHRFASTCGRSLAILRRLMPTLPGRRPEWSAAPSPALLAAMLAGAWRQDVMADRAVLERLAGQPYGQIEQELTGFAATLDGPLRRSGEVWKLASLRDAWFLMAPHVTDRLVGEVAAVFQEIMGEVSPNFHRPPGDAWWRPHSEDGHTVSAVLRRGVCEAMIVLGVYADQATNAPTARQIAESSVKALLKEAPGPLWWSLSDDFRRLAEAAPQTFLDAVDAALDAGVLDPLFRSDEGLLHPTEYLSDMLWALEMLAWSPELLAQATLLLARMDEIDSGGRTLNRPANALRRIFLPWSPQTYAGAESRLQVLKLLMQRHPSVGWKTLLALAPRGHDIQTPSPVPVWRDFTASVPEGGDPRGLYFMYEAIGKRLIEQAGTDAGRWTALFEVWANFHPDWRRAAATKLATVAPTFDDERKIVLREALRDLLHHHESFPDADWSMSAEDLAPLSAIFAQLEPASATVRHAWLFNSSSAHRQRGRSWQESERALEAAQTQAAADILSEVGPAGFLAFGESVQMTRPLGAALVRSQPDEALLTGILWTGLLADDAAAGAMALGMLFQLRQDRGADWLAQQFNAAVAADRPLRALLRLAAALPADRTTWALVDAAGTEVAEAYWRDRDPWIPQSADVLAACDRFLQVGRGKAAIQVIAQHEEVEIPSDLMIHLLDAAAASPNDVDDDRTMWAYYIARAFQRLDKDPTAPAADLVRLEWTYFSALEHSERPPRTLHKALAEDPAFFVELLKLVFLPSADSGVKEPAPPDRAQAEAVATQAYRVLEHWAVVPGTDDQGEIDGEALSAWVREARRLCVEAGRGEIGDQKIGQILAAAARKPGEAWPPESVRDVIEQARNENVEIGFAIGLYNRRGVTVRSPFDGGKLERELVAQYRADARAVAAFWPRTRALLDRIADGYLRDAQREDQSAEQRDW